MFKRAKVTESEAILYRSLNTTFKDAVLITLRGLYQPAPNI